MNSSSEYHHSDESYISDDGDDIDDEMDDKYMSDSGQYSTDECEEISADVSSDGVRMDNSDGGDDSLPEGSDAVESRYRDVNKMISTLNPDKVACLTGDF